MDKKKVKELIEDATYKLNYFDEEQDNYEGLRMDIVETLEQVVKELSKSDWISVEDEPAPRLEWDGSWNDIVVCYKDKWVLPLSYVVRNDVEFTHWRRIEKLEE